MARRPYLIADLFCGAGGSSTGAEKAIAEIGGKMELVAVNHWDTAIATHSANHPKARHYIENLETADPEAIVPEGRLDLLMASPECKYRYNSRKVKDELRFVGLLGQVQGRVEWFCQTEQAENPYA